MKLPHSDNPPPALDPSVTYRENVIEAEAESLERMRKVARVQGFEVYCDDGERVSREPAILFGSSSGAIVAVAVLTRHASLVRTLVPFEPPAVNQLADGRKWLDFFSDVYDLYCHSGLEPALQEFREHVLAESDRQVLARAMTDNDRGQMVANARYWFEHELRQYPAVELDLDALQARANRIVLAVGRESRGYPAHRVNVELANKLGKDTLELPGGHLGFASQPAEFARELVEALARQEQSAEA